MNISSAAGIDLFERIARGIALVKFDVQTWVESSNAVRDYIAGISWDDQAKPADGSAMIGFAKPFEPQQCKCKTVVYSVLGFAIRHGKKAVRTEPRLDNPRA